MNAENLTSIVVMILTLVFTAAGVMLWHKINRTERRAEQAHADLSEFKLYVAREYPNNAQLDKAIAVITGQFEQLFDRLGMIESDIRGMGNSFRDKLDQKADRVGHHP